MNKKILNVALAMLLCVSLSSATFLTAKEKAENSIDVSSSELVEMPENGEEDLVEPTPDTENLPKPEETMKPSEDNSEGSTENLPKPEETMNPSEDNSEGSTENLPKPEETMNPSEDNSEGSTEDVEPTPTETPEIVDKEENANDDSETIAFSVTTIANSNEVNVQDGKVVLDETGLSVNGTNIQGYDSTQPLVLTGKVEDITETYISIFNVETTIIFRNLSISSKDGGPQIKPINISGTAKVDIILEEQSIVENKGYFHAALSVGSRAEITIAGSGLLEAAVTGSSGATAGCGIGGSGQPNGNAGAGNITINGGTIKAEGGCGIGGSDINHITINGGSVTGTAQGYANGPGIGSSNNGTVKGGIHINGGTVYAVGGRGSAGIGVGGASKFHNDASIKISGNADVYSIGGYEGSGIGGGQTTTGSVKIDISGNPQIRVKSGRNTTPDIGYGSQQSSANAFINISGGKIITDGEGVGIGGSSWNNRGYADVLISDTTIESEKNERSIYARKLSIANSVIDAKNGGIYSGYDTWETTNENTTITGTTINGGSKFAIYVENTNLYTSLNKMKVTQITMNSNGIFQDEFSEINMPIVVSYSAILAGKGEIALIGTKLTIPNLESPEAIYAEQGIYMEGCDIDINYTLNSDTAYAIKSLNEIELYNNDINVTMIETAPPYGMFFLVGKNIDINGGNYVSNGSIVSTIPGGEINLHSGYLNLTTTSTALKSSGDITIRNGYVNTSGTIEADGSFTLGNDTDAEDPIVFAKKIASPTWLKLNQGIMFLEEDVPNYGAFGENFVGRVYGDVVLGNPYYQDVNFVVPSNYKLKIYAGVAKSLVIPENMNFINEGEIYNQIDVEVLGSFTNKTNAKLYNHNLTKYLLMETGGQLSGDGTLVNDGTVINEVYVAKTQLDNVDYEVVGAKLKTISNGVTLEEHHDNHVDANQGINELYYNDIMAFEDIKSEWKYINTDVNFYTVTYDNNDTTGATNSLIVGNVHLTKPTDPTRTGYVFDGWHLGAINGGSVDLLDPWDFTIKVNGTMTLYAKWKLAAPSPSPTPSPNPVRTCQDDGYPEGYYWSESAQACIIDKVVVKPTTKPTVTPTITPSSTPTIEENPNTQEPTAIPTSNPSNGNQVESTDVDESGSWSLVTVISTFITLIIAITLIVMKKEDKEIKSDKVTNYRRNKAMMWVVIPLSIVSVVIVLLTQSFTQPMVWVDAYSMIVAIIMMISILLACLGSIWKEVE